MCINLIAGNVTCFVVCFSRCCQINGAERLESSTRMSYLPGHLRVNSVTDIALLFRPITDIHDACLLYLFSVALDSGVVFIVAPEARWLHFDLTPSR